MLPDQLKTILEAHDKLTQGMASTKEVAEVFTALMNVMKELKAKLEQDVKENKGEVTQMCVVMKSEIASIEKSLDKMVKAQQDETAKALKGVVAQIKALEEEIPDETDLSPLEAKLSQLTASIPVIKDVMPEVNKKLDDLYEELKKYIDDKPKTEVQTRSIIGGRVGIQVYDNGAKDGTKVNAINFGAGLSVYTMNGLTTVISMTSGPVITVTGTIDDSNMTFTVASEPSVAIINGAGYLPTGGAVTWSYLAGTVTLSTPVGVNGAIFFLK